MSTRQNKQRKIEKLQAEDAELKRLDLLTRDMRKKAEITCKIFRISQQLKKLEGGFESPEYKRAMEAMTKYCDEHNAKLEDKMKGKAKRKSKSKKRKRKETQTHFLRDEEAGIVCAIIHE